MRQDITIKRPIISEKSMLLAENGRYTFEISPEASKHQVKEAVEKTFGVTVVSLTTTAIRGKEKRFGARRRPTKLADSKKAVVTLKKGQKIDLFDIKEEK